MVKETDENIGSKFRRLCECQITGLEEICVNLSLNSRSTAAVTITKFIWDDAAGYGEDDDDGHLFDIVVSSRGPRGYQS